MLAKTPDPPYYAVIFTSIRTENAEGYVLTTEHMLQLAEQQDGYLGEESARNEIGITVSYWRDLDAIKAWKAHAVHKIAQENGRKLWYKSYKTRIAKVEREYGFEAEG